MAETAKEKFSVSYDAESGDYKNHEIDALTLSRSIQGVYNMVAEANALINKGAEVSLKVTAPASEGSVIVEYLLLASNPQALAVLKYLGLSAPGVAIAGGSLIEVVKKLKNRRVVNMTVDEDSDIARIEVDGEVVECDKYVAKLATDKKVRDALHSVVQAPVAGRDGATFKVLDGQDNQVLEIGHEAANDYSPLPKRSLEKEEVRKETTTAYFVQVNFESNYGWRVKLADGVEHAVTLADEKFMDKVNQNQQSFSKDDLFEIVIETKSTYRQTRSTHNYTVLEVTRHFADKERRLV
ncbi:hypothetical protein [Pseudomonas aeruginosa]|uniref:hypothetical protein n=1 Tax=Pseudomonas aeruginosa TaxID=287 RepID=UPI0021F13530|nr:hypothetical protein [Pseudomonas aeruginosa]MCV6429385.1 hypothetical protein [Pseudomonas aeruginosa]MCV6437383.1 hypothetical protein [Pseudomonas aeruginosa]